MGQPDDGDQGLKVIRYHGGPITPVTAAIEAWRGRHAMVSFYRPEQVALAHERAVSVALDNGAFSNWRAGYGRIDVSAYLKWVRVWHRHPAFDWCLIPDVIDGTEEENTTLAREWPLEPFASVPVWHMHESFERLTWLMDGWPRIAIGSSGQFAQIGTPQWWERIAGAMDVVCDEKGRPLVKLHGLRQMDPEVFSVVPYSSVDSTNIARNIGIDQNWKGAYVPRRRETRAVIIRDNLEQHAAAARWPGRDRNRNLELYG